MLAARRRNVWALFVLLGIGMLVLLSWTTCSLLTGCPRIILRPPAPKVLIVDQADIISPNGTFRRSIESIFDKAKIPYDVVGGKNVTVDFYRNLSLKGYRLIIIRVSGCGLLGPISPNGPTVYLFTGELYSSSKYVEEQLRGAVVPFTLTAFSPVYFAVTPLFVEHYMGGAFSGTVIALTCGALINTKLADAFLSRGASAVVSWDEYVSESHGDLGFTLFLEDFVTRAMTIQQSVQDTEQKTGPDPDYGSRLLYYPGTAGTVTALDLLSSNWSNTTTISTYTSKNEAGLWTNNLWHYCL